MPVAFLPVAGAGLKSVRGTPVARAHTRPRLPTRAAHRAPIMSAPYNSPEFWDETAPSMLDFALSGPGWAAAGLAAAAAGLLVATLFDVGPRRKGKKGNAGGELSADTGAFFYVRITVSKPVAVELPSGTVARLAAGEETVLREARMEAADALARGVAGAADAAAADCRCTVYRADGTALVPLREYPRDVDAPGVEGWGKDGETEGSGNARWDEYARLGSIGSVEKEWRKVVNSLGGVRREPSPDMVKGACKLCSGTGRHKCHRCMGASAGGRMQCPVCTEGRVACEYCEGSGRAV